MSNFHNLGLNSFLSPVDALSLNWFIDEFRFFYFQKASSMIMVFMVFLIFLIHLFLLILIHLILSPGRKLVVAKFERFFLFSIVLLNLFIFILPHFIPKLLLLFGSVFNLVVFKMLIELLFFLWVVDQSNCCSSFVGNFHYLIWNLN